MTIDAAEVGRQLGRVSPQRWSMSFAALVAAAGAAVVTGAAAGGQSLFAITLVIGLAGLTVARPDTHLGLGVLVTVVWYWLAAVEDPTSPWVMAVAVALFVFHAVVALLATTGPAATIDPVSLRRWLLRSTAVVAATVTTWLVVVVFDRQSSPGSVWLTALALVAALALTAALRSALPHDEPGRDGVSAPR